MPEVVCNYTAHLFSMQAKCYLGEVAETWVRTTMSQQLLCGVRTAGWQKVRCRVGRAVTHPGPSPDPDERISRIRLFRRCGSWLHLSTTFTSSGDMLSNVSALGMVLW